MLQGSNSASYYLNTKSYNIKYYKYFFLEDYFYGYFWIKRCEWYFYQIDGRGGGTSGSAGSSGSSGSAGSSGTSGSAGLEWNIRKCRIKWNIRKCRIRNIQSPSGGAGSSQGQQVIRIK
jgi:hypothetical protein